MVTFDEVPLDRITDGDMTIAHLACGHHKFYVGHTVEVGRRALCAEPDHAYPDGHGATRVEGVVRTSTVTVIYSTVD